MDGGPDPHFRLDAILCPILWMKRYQLQGHVVHPMIFSGTGKSA